jgi:hypothetical protein
MNAVFLGGSRAITRLTPDVRQRIDEIINQRLPILVGDANGADKAIQRYLASKRHREVTIFCTGDRCRNNVANWPAKRVTAHRRSKGVEFYAAKDREMAREATVGLMVWDGRSLGTALNVVRMLKQGKKVELYEIPTRKLWVLWSDQDWLSLLAQRDTRLTERLKRRIYQEPTPVPADAQRELPFANRGESQASQADDGRRPWDPTCAPKPGRLYHL